MPESKFEYLNSWRPLFWRYYYSFNLLRSWKVTPLKDQFVTHSFIGEIIGDCTELAFLLWLHRAPLDNLQILGIDNMPMVQHECAEKQKTDNLSDRRSKWGQFSEGLFLIFQI
jgi:hypothetical protein